MKHIPILLKETIEGLAIKPDGIYVDATLGRGGHSRAILEHLNKGHLYSFDVDQEAIDYAQQTLVPKYPNFTPIHANFSQIKEKLQELFIDHVDGVLFDLGVSSPQFDDPTRGFSYRYEARLDMRMDQTQTLDAYTVVNEYSEEDLRTILRVYGEEPFAHGIAKAIVKNRPITTTFELVEVIKSVLPQRILKKKGHPAKQTFQALRIEVNNELDSIQKALEEVVGLLKPLGRMVVITFHSLEDRLVKQYFNQLSTPKKVDKRLPILNDETIQFEHLTKKVLLPNPQEIIDNPRSASAKARILAKKGE